MKKVAVIGLGLVGEAMAFDLATEFEVIGLDADSEKVERIQAKGMATKTLNVLDVRELEKALSTIEIVVLAVPGFLGFEALGNLLSLGKKVVDISFFPEDPKKLSDIAKQNNTWAITDCGIAPGYSHLAAGEYAKKGLERFSCFVGGLPFERVQPFEYKAPFSPVDVLEEYTRPARYKEKGEILTIAPLELLEQLTFENIGTLEAFISDGLRSLLYTLPHTPNMIEKTLRYPGHAEKIKLLKNIGLLDETPVSLSNGQVSPLALTAKLLLKDWELTPIDDEFTLMRLECEGKNWKEVITVFDTRNYETGFSSMARTTGYTATAMLRFLLREQWADNGVFVPEEIALQTKVFAYITEQLKEHGIGISIEKLA